MRRSLVQQCSGSIAQISAHERKRSPVEPLKQIQNNLPPTCSLCVTNNAGGVHQRHLHRTHNTNTDTFHRPPHTADSSTHHDATRTHRSLRRLPDVVQVSVGASPGPDHSARCVSTQQEERPSVRDDLVLPTTAPTSLAIAGDHGPSFDRHDRRTVVLWTSNRTLK